VKISLEALKSVYAQETGDYPIFLLTFSHRDLKDDIRISTDPTTRLPGMTTDEMVVYGTVSNGQEYIFCGMEISWPTEDEESAPMTQLSISNIGRELVEMIRSMRYSPRLTMTLVLASNTDMVEGRISGMEFSEVEINTMLITGTLTINMRTNEPFPFRTFTPSTAPGIFKE